MKKYIFRVIAVLASCWILLSILNYFYIYPFDNYISRLYEKQFLKNSTVISIQDHLHYEGTRYITLNLKNGGELDIAGFNFFIFFKTNSIFVLKVNGLDLECRKNKNDSFTSIGVNIISLVNASPLKIKIENIGDLVKNFDSIYHYIQTFPTNPENAKLVNMDNKVDKNTDHWCHIKQLRK